MVGETVLKAIQRLECMHMYLALAYEFFIATKHVDLVQTLQCVLQCVQCVLHVKEITHLPQVRNTKSMHEHIVVLLPLYIYEVYMLYVHKYC